MWSNGLTAHATTNLSSLLRRVNWWRITPSCIAQSLCLSPPYHLKSWNAHCPAVLLIGYLGLSSHLYLAHVCSRSYIEDLLVGLSQSIESAMFWYKIWEESGCPLSGVLSRRYKYEVCPLVRRQNSLLQKKLAYSVAKKYKSSFWSDVRKLTISSSSFAPVVDGVAILLICLLKSLRAFSIHSSSPHISLQSPIQSSVRVTASHVCDVEFSEDDVLDAHSHLNSGKSDGDGIISEHLIYASSAVRHLLPSSSAHLFVTVLCLSVFVTLFLFQYPRRIRMPPAVLTIVL